MCKTRSTMPTKSTWRWRDVRSKSSPGGALNTHPACLLLMMWFCQAQIPYPFLNTVEGTPDTTTGYKYPSLNTSNQDNPCWCSLSFFLSFLFFYPSFFPSFFLSFFLSLLLLSCCLSLDSMGSGQFIQRSECASAHAQP